MRVVRLPLLLAPVAVVVALVVALVLALLLPALIAIVIGVAAGVGAAAFMWVRSESAVLGTLRPIIVDEDQEPSIFNMMEGLCDTHGFRRPRLAIIDEPARNALVYGRGSHRVTLVVTTGLRDVLTPMELEGLLSRELALATNEGLPAATVLVPILGLLPASLRSKLTTWWTGEHRVMLDDFDAVQYTRYPPGLAAALEKLEQGSTFVAGAGRNASHLWVAPPVDEGSPSPTYPTIEARADALREL